MEKRSEEAAFFVALREDVRSALKESGYSLDTPRLNAFMNALRGSIDRFGQTREREPSLSEDRRELRRIFKLADDPDPSIGLIRKRLQELGPSARSYLQRRADRLPAMDSDVRANDPDIFLWLEKAPPETLSDAWNARLAAIDDRRKLCDLRVLGSFASSRGIEPDGVDEALLTDLEAAAREKALRRPTQLMRTIRIVWNERLDADPSWPPIRLTVTSRLRTPSVSAEALLPDFVRDLDAFVERSSNGGRFIPRRKGPRSPATKRDVRRRTLQIVTLLEKRGFAIAKLTSLADLVTKEALDLVLDTLWDEGRGAECNHHGNRVRLLKSIAKHWVHADEDVIELLQEAERAFREPHDGMVDSNRRKLRPFTDPQNIRLLVNLPRKEVEGLDQVEPTLSDAHRVQSALAVALLLVAPVRAKNLASVDITRHIHRVSDTVCYLVFASHEVKNRTDLEYPLPPATIELVDLYIRIYRPLLSSEESTALFVSRTGRQKTEAELGAQILRFIKTRIGFHFNLHAFRHLAAFIFLKRHPGDFETVRRLLGHKSLRTTTMFYTGLEHADAYLRFDAVLDSYKDPGAGEARP